MAKRVNTSDGGAVRCPRGFFAVDAERLALRLLGCVLVRRLDDGTRLSGTIVETEAYIGEEDRACHSYGMRRTTRNESMYARPGTAYIYFTYGMHHCFNVVCGREGEPVAALVRAIEPLEGIEHMRALRAAGRAGGSPPRDREIAAGPGRLCRAMMLDRTMDGLDLCSGGALWIERGRPISAARIARSARIGVGGAGAEWAGRELRFLVADNPHVSGPRGAGIATR